MSDKRIIQIKREKWWVSVWVDDQHKGNYYPRFVFPWLAVSPWHKSVLASTFERELWVLTIELGWWIWRGRLAWGRVQEVGR